jgi:class 3 adenylate cyclase
MLAETEQFLRGLASSTEPERLLATFLFTDIVGSTEHAARVGDTAWRHLLEQHDGRVRARLAEFRGKELSTTGDGFFASFDGPGRAIRCARAIRDDVRALGLEIRVGLHTGEGEQLNGTIGGIAVHLAARVAALAGAGEILVSSTVRDLVAGSLTEFDDRGEHVLRGIPGAWRLYAVRG